VTAGGGAAPPAVPPRRGLAARLRGVSRLCGELSGGTAAFTC